MLAVACLSLAAKMEEVNVPVTVDLQARKILLKILDAAIYMYMYLL